MTGRAGVLAAVAAALLALPAACVVPRASVDASGRLEVLGPGPGFSPRTLPADWVIEGRDRVADGQLSVARKEGVPALRVVSGAEGFVIARRIRAILLTTPYLSWAWNMEPQGSGVHPVRLLIGFHGGDPQSLSWGGQPFVWMGSALPPHDRLLSLAWGDSALQRGTLTRPPGRHRHAPSRYTVRGGRENTGTWWLETVDLSQLYARAWPGDDVNRAQVMFIGIAAAGGHKPAAAYLSGIVLSR